MAHADRSVDVGGRLKRLREERGMALRAVADATKLSVRALESVERNEISRLPGGIFLRATVRAYAAEVGADPDQAIRDLIESFPQESVTLGTSAAVAPRAAPPSRHDFSQLTIRAALALPIVAILVWSYLALT